MLRSLIPKICKNLVTSVSILLHLVAIAFYFFNLWVNATFFPKFSSKSSVILWISFTPQFPLKRNRPENSIFIAFDKVSSEVLLSLSPGCPESLLGDNNNNKKVTFRFNITNTYNSCTNLSLWWQVMQRCVLEYPKVMICQCFSFRFSPKSLVDLALLERKKEALIKQTLQGRIQDFFEEGLHSTFALLQHQ